MGSGLHRRTAHVVVVLALGGWATAGCGVRSFVVGDAAATDTDGSGGSTSDDSTSTQSTTTTSEDDTMESDAGTTASSTGESTSGAAETSGADSGDVECDTLGQAECDQTDDCSWMSEYSVCVDQQLVEMCQMQQTDTDCLAAGCEWDMAESRCEYEPG